MFWFPFPLILRKGANVVERALQPTQKAIQKPFYSFFVALIQSLPFLEDFQVGAYEFAKFKCSSLLCIPYRTLTAAAHLTQHSADSEPGSFPHDGDLIRSTDRRRQTQSRGFVQSPMLAGPTPELISSNLIPTIPSSTSTSNLSPYSISSPNR